MISYDYYAAIFTWVAMPVGLLAPKYFLVVVVVVVVEDVDVVDLLTVDVASFFTTFFSRVLMMVVSWLDTERVDLAGVNSSVLRLVVTGIVDLAADGRFRVDPLTSVLIGVLVRRGMLLLDGDDLVAAESFDLLVVVEDELL